MYEITMSETRFTDGRECRWKKGAAALLCIMLLQLWTGGVMQLTRVSAQGSWNLLVENAGIASMHTAITRFNTAILLDRTDIGPSQINLPNGECRNNPTDLLTTHDCTAHSVELNLATNEIRPLFIYTDTWCSSGQFDANGVLVQTGGDFDGLYKIRRFAPCGDGSCDWVEDDTDFLQKPRWYSTNQQLPDGTQIVIGGRQAPYVEFVPQGGTTATQLELLVITKDYQQDNLYPYVHLLPNGYLFIFANTQSIIYDYNSATTISSLPQLPGDPRNYPSAGSSVMLPLQASDGFSTAEIVICGGALLGAFTNRIAQYLAADDCGRISPMDTAPSWAIEYMPTSRTMGEMLLLPDQTTLIINGAQRGSEGFEEASDPCFSPLNYDPNAAAGSRFSTWSPTTIPRLYHSTANVLPDGRILVAGSNTHLIYAFTGLYPTELRVEAFSPPYLDSSNDGDRPSITNSPTALGYGEEFSVTVTIANAPGNVTLVMYNAPWSTHAFSQGQRQLILATEAPVDLGPNSYTISGTSPPNTVIAPPSYYMLFVVNDGIPGPAAWVQMADS